MGWTYVLGGIGLFLLGMSMMTDGLKELADDALRKWLNRFTGGTFRAILSGTVITLLIQSSSAATIITIGFVSAGLISFTQSIGIIIGANIGTTSIGWIISLIGFKISLTAMSLPIIGAGALFRVFASNSLKPYGSVLTGFGLLFLGLATLQEGMTVQGDMLALSLLQGDGFLHHVLLVLMGFIMTVILQSSSASVATTLTFLHVGAITFDQGIFLVIGHHIGTTITALVAAMGASVSAKRTALTHVLFNLGTALVITTFSPIFISLTVFISTLISGTFDGVLGIAVFHTLFSLVGALIFVPFIHPFAKFIKRIIPEKGNPLTQYLDKNVATVPAVALEAAYKTLVKIINILTEEIISLVRWQKISNTFDKTIEKIEDAIAIMRKFLDSLHPHSLEDQNKLLSLIHALDHIERLIKVLKEEQRLEAISLQQNLMGEWVEILEQIPQSKTTDDLIKIATELENISTVIAEERRVKRNKYFLQSVRSETELETALAKVQALLWMDRLAYHYWRAIYRLTDSGMEESSA